MPFFKNYGLRKLAPAQIELMKPHWDTVSTQPLAIAQVGTGVIVPGSETFIQEKPIFKPSRFGCIAAGPGNDCDNDRMMWS
jgi:hypothetical protein